MEIVVGPSEMQVGNTSEVILVSSSLGSGIGLAACDPETHFGGILHFLLPSSVISRPKAQENPFLFADTGIPAFLDAMAQNGVKKNNLKVVSAGGSHIMDQKAPFDIAQRNCLAVEIILKQHRIPLSHKDFHGNFYRHIRIERGSIYVEIPGHGEREI